MQLSGRVVLVTGASRGLGRALATTLAARGARVACSARDGAALDAVVEAIAEAGGMAKAFPCDLAEPGAAAGLVARVESELGPLSVLLANHGSTTAGEVRDLRLADFERDLRTNFLAATALTAAALPGLRERGGTLGYVLSGLAHRPLPAWSAYAASKAALRAYADALRVELAGGPVRVLTIQPGPLRTDFLARMARVGRPRIIEPRRAARPEDVAETIVRALERDRARVSVFGPASLVRAADLVAPRLVDWLLGRRHRGG